MSQTPREERLIRARSSLEGLSVGDAFGERWFFSRSGNTTPFTVIQDRTLPPRPWEFTDDTNMALSIVSILRQHDGIDQDGLARNFGKHFEISRGYGPAMYSLLPRLRAGYPWKREARTLFSGQGSFGNGAAMRVAPLGAYFADDMDSAVEHARRSAEITHAHAEGIAGAVAVAVAAAWAARLSTSKARPTRQEFIDMILPLVPDGMVCEKIRHARELIPGTTVRLAIAALGNGSGISAQDTVPFTLWCAGEHLDNYEEALWLTVSGGGDIDTNCAIVGGIVASYTGIEGIPREWLQCREPLPDWPFHEMDTS
jgi:ADP-ribosylglycohydrolase